MDKISKLIFEMSKSGTQFEQAVGFLSQVMNHLFKIKYTESSFYVEKWTKDINRNLGAARKTCSHKNSVLSKMKRSENINRAYSDAIKAYRKDYRTDKHMADPGKIPLPQSCPWTVDDLFNDSITDLLSKLPEIKSK